MPSRMIRIRLLGVGSGGAMASARWSAAPDEASAAAVVAAAAGAGVDGRPVDCGLDRRRDACDHDSGSELQRLRFWLAQALYRHVAALGGWPLHQRRDVGRDRLHPPAAPWQDFARRAPSDRPRSRACRRAVRRYVKELLGGPRGAGGRCGIQRRRMPAFRLRRRPDSGASFRAEQVARRVAGAAMRRDLRPDRRRDSIRRFARDRLERARARNRGSSTRRQHADVERKRQLVAAASRRGTGSRVMMNA